MSAALDECCDTLSNNQEDKMKNMTSRFNCLTLAATLLMAVTAAYAAMELTKYDVHDVARPTPDSVRPADRPGDPPSDAIILFDGKDTSPWVADKGGPCTWKIEDGYMEVTPKSGSIHTAREFGNCQLHIEWRTPDEVKGSSQGRGNGGVFFMGRYELQILDSWENPTYADGQAAAIYGQTPPMFNAAKKPGEWQTYDVAFLRPVFDEAGNCVRPARITVFHNGVCVQNNVEIQGATAHRQKAQYRRHPDKGALGLQDHNNPTRFRNIWVMELPEQPYLIK